MSIAATLTPATSLKPGDTMPNPEVVILTAGGRQIVHLHDLIPNDELVAWFSIPAANTKVCTEEHVPSFFAQQTAKKVYCSAVNF